MRKKASVVMAAKIPDMEKPSYGDKTPIAATATPLAESALALVRTSGGGVNSTECSAVQLLSKVFSRPEELFSAEGNTIVHGWIIEPDTKEKLDEVVVSVYRSPKSYTGEDSADISLHGGIATVKAVMAALKKAGFRDALPGEFTFRAFLNGKLDLTRAESVMELVSAKTHKGREQAIRRLSGVLEKEITEIKNLLVEVLSGTEIFLDYSEDEFLDPENDEEAGRLPARNLAQEAERKLKAISDLWNTERLYAEGALLVLAGRPNAGKSSLFNYLLREDRSIVTESPGTTRDWIEALISIEGIPLRLADTAGLREIDHTEGNEAEKIGMERSLELIDKADIVLYLIDGIQGFTKDDRDFLQKTNAASPEKILVPVWNKNDIASPPLSIKDDLPPQLIPISAKTGEGIGNLLSSITGLLEKKASPECSGTNTAGPGTLRQKELIDSALSSVNEALLLADKMEP
ncbi:MAG: tRNA uridine-5-carboxymethylaminomethyl(34) synthesis GTPase MnmE, partial [Treponema sp.]|nr:tRNA uridine-5-carboxymethylaminomethyl(34) synthesis GTPase MnmE [Treponema sp.]